MRIITIILVQFLAYSQLFAQNIKLGKTSDEIHDINFRNELKAEQYDRELRTEKYKAREEKIFKRVENKQLVEEAKIAKAEKKALQRHMKFQSKETRRRIAQNKKRSSQSFWK